MPQCAAFLSKLPNNGIERERENAHEEPPVQKTKTCVTIMYGNI